MKIAVFRSSSLFAAWSVSQGITEVLEQMGHEVLDCPINPSSNQVSRSRFPNQEQLEACDGILISGIEHLSNHLNALYPEWKSIKAPKAGWMHETVEHPTYRILPDELKKLADTVFCPGIQDEKHGFKYLPFGVDTNVFSPVAVNWERVPAWEYKPGPKKYDAAFIGSVYPKRAEFLQQLQPHLDGIKLRVGMVSVQDLSGDCQRQTAELLAENIRQIKVFVNLPAMSGHVVTKVTEAAACGTMIVTPFCGDDEVSLGTSYHSEASCAFCIKSLLKDDERREQKAAEACREVHENHRLDQRLTEILKSF